MSADGQAPLFDAQGLEIPEEIALTLRPGPLQRPARVGFLAGMLAVWALDGKPDEAQKERLKEIARDAILEARTLAVPNSEGASDG